MYFTEIQKSRWSEEKVTFECARFWTVIYESYLNTGMKKEEGGLYYGHYDKQCYLTSVLAVPPCPKQSK